MNFLYPSFLFGLLALSVPIAIHLFNFRRTRRVFFTNVALLRTVQTETKQKQGISAELRRKLKRQLPREQK